MIINRKFLFRAGIFLILFQPVCFAQNIPQDWLGDWYGKLTINVPKGTVATIDMELHLSTTDNPYKWNYTIVYDEGESRDERKYTLIKSDSISGLYTIDENNGIIINEMNIENKMFQRFKINDNVIYGITTYEKGKITWELVSDFERHSLQTGNGDEEIPFVTSYYPINYQRAVLTKKKPKNKK